MLEWKAWNKELPKLFELHEILFFFVFVFQTTGLTRLIVAKNPHHTLTALYGKTLRALAKMPPTAAYRTHTEKIITERAKIVANVRTLEFKIELLSAE